MTKNTCLQSIIEKHGEETKLEVMSNNVLIKTKEGLSLILNKDHYLLFKDMPLGSYLVKELIQYEPVAKTKKAKTAELEEKPTVSSESAPVTTKETEEKKLVEPPTALEKPKKKRVRRSNTK